MSNENDCDCEYTIDEYLKAAKNNIESFGVHLTGVYGNSCEPGFTYTVGNTARNKPEIIIKGLPFEYAQIFLNQLSLFDFKDYEIDIPILELANLPLIVRPLEVNELLQTEYMTMVGKFFDWKNVELVQAIWCDKEGKFPWDNDFDTTMYSLQDLISDKDPDLSYRWKERVLLTH